MFRLLRFHCHPTPLFTLMQMVSRSRDCHVRKWLYRCVLFLNDYRAIFGPDDSIASIPMPSYSFNLSDTNDSQVTWLSREEVVISVCTKWKWLQKVSAALMVQLLRFHCHSTHFITLMQMTIRWCDCHVRKWSYQCALIGNDCNGYLLTWLSDCFHSIAVLLLSSLWCQW